MLICAGACGITLFILSIVTVVIIYSLSVRAEHGLKLNRNGTVIIDSWSTCLHTNYLHGTMLLFDVAAIITVQKK